MIRVAFNIVLFVLPFVLYWLWLKYARARGKGPDEVTNRHIAALAAAGLVLGGLGFWLIGHGDSSAPKSVYVPARIEDGKLIPGRFEPVQERE